MNWNAAALRQREALKCIAAALLAMAAGGATLPRHLHRTVLRLLRPAEAAARRLIIALARDLPAAPVRKAGPRRPPERPTILAGGVGTGILMPRGTFALTLPHAPLQKLALPLLDPLPSRAPGGRARRSASAGVPRISVPGCTKRFPIAARRPPSPDDPIDATRLRLRLQALAATLEDLPRAARRFARWRALARDAPNAASSRDGRNGFRRVWPLRPGRPPGWRRKPLHPVHEVLNEAHWLALTALERRDTS